MGTDITTFTYLFPIHHIWYGTVIHLTHLTDLAGTANATAAGLLPFLDGVGVHGRLVYIDESGLPGGRKTVYINQSRI
jgi:hypothetical protein